MLPRLCRPGLVPGLVPRRPSVHHSPHSPVPFPCLPALQAVLCGLPVDQSYVMGLVGAGSDHTLLPTLKHVQLPDCRVQVLATIFEAVVEHNAITGLWIETDSAG